MATQATFTAKAQNSFPGTTVIDAVQHGIPEFKWTPASLHSVVGEFTGTGSNNITCGASGAITVNGVTAKDPITGSNVDFDNHHGFALYFGRAAVGTAPTGTPAVTLAPFADLDNSAAGFTVAEGFFWMMLHQTAKNAANGNVITVNLTSTTGYKVSLVAFGSSD